MVLFEQRPWSINTSTYNPAPAPARAEYWDYYVWRGFTGELVPALSTRAVVYSGIIATELPMLMPTCDTANCSWPIIPTLGACGECVPIPVSSDCNSSTNTCTYSTQSGTSVDLPENSSNQGLSRVAPSNGTGQPLNTTDQAYFSVFDIISAISDDSGSVNTEANECALWFCLHSYLIFVTDGHTNETLMSDWSTTAFEYGTSTHGAQYRFIDIPGEMNVNNDTKYAISQTSLSVLRAFMASLTLGTVTINADSIDYSSDWIEATWNGTSDLGGWIATFTQSMTNEIRAHGTIRDPSSKQYNGGTTQLAPFVRVQWLWLIYPGLLLAMTVFFLMRTVWIGGRDGVSVWKSDALPMLFCRIDTSIHDKVKDAMDVPHGLDQRVGYTRVALLKGTGGDWTFKTLEEEA